MRTFSWWLSCSLALVALGCNGSTATSPLNPSGTTGGEFPTVTGQTSLGTSFQAGDILNTAVGLYTVSVDPTTLSATSQLKETRSGQANDDLFELSIDSFLNANSFKITGVDVSPSTFSILYNVSHPFPAPSDPTGSPNGSTNRSDLGISGQVLFLMDVPSATGNTFFTDKIANTAVVANADAYYAPAGLISTTGLTANTFPYKHIVDEVVDGTGSRVGISNGGDVTGNFGADGWTRGEYGAGNNGWTGFGFLHGGQTSANSLELNTAAITGPLNFDVAIIAKYGDPRGGANASAKRGNRLPPASPDASLFAYRGFHDALDVAQIAYAGEGGGFIPNQIGGSELRFHVVDWDARATETTEADLADDADFNTVEVGESGVPTLTVCIPGVTGDATSSVDLINGPVDDDSSYGGDAGQDSGVPGDALFYAETVTKTVTSGQSGGAFTGLVRATDPGTEVVTALDGAASPPAPLASNLPEAVTYQAFTVLQNSLPVATGGYTVPNVVFGNNALNITVDGLADGDADDIDIEVDWDDNGTWVVAATVMDPYPASVPVTSPGTYTWSGSDPDTRNLPVRLNDGTSIVPLTPTQTFDVVEPCPAAPYAGTNLSGSYSSWGVYGYGFSTSTPSLDFAACQTAISPYGYGAALFYTTSNGMYLAMPTSPSSGSLSNWTSMSAGNLPPGMPHQIETDPSATAGIRVLLAHVDPTFPTGTSQPGSALQIYDTFGATPNFYFYDQPTYSSSATTYTTVSTGTDRVIAMTVDDDGNVIFIDQNHVMHKYDKGTPYAETTDAPYPVDLAPIIGTNAGSGDANRKVVDLVYNSRNKNVFILVESQASLATATKVFRVECDGTALASINGNPNPLVFQNQFSDTSQNVASDINIRQRDNSFNVFANQGEAQIECTNRWSGQMARWINADMQQYYQWVYYSNVHHGVWMDDRHFLLGISGGTSINSWAGLYPAVGWQ